MSETQHELWEGYLYPSSYTLRNRLGIESFWQLRGVEYALAGDRMRELHAGEVTIDRTYDDAHLRAIHAHLFGDLYHWAGQHRTVDMTKGSQVFAMPTLGHIDVYLDDASDQIYATDWAHLGREEFAEAAAIVLASLNHAHPFREGNGRATKVFLNDVADLTAPSPAEPPRWAFAWDHVDPDAWNEAARASAPAYGPHHQRPDARELPRPQWPWLVPVLHEATIDSPQLDLPEETAHHRQPHRAPHHGAGGGRPVPRRHVEDVSFTLDWTRDQEAPQQAPALDLSGYER